MLIVKTEPGLKYFKDLFQQKSLAETIELKEQVPLKKFYRAQVLITPKGEKFLNTIITPHIIQELVKPKVPHYEPKMGITKITQVETKISNNELSLRAQRGNPPLSMDRVVPRDDVTFTNIELEILTGRTHQIRYHLSQQ